MSKLIRLHRRTSNFLLVSILILLVGYIILLRYLGNIFPLPIFVEIKRVYGIMLAIGLLVLFLVLGVANYSTIIRAALLIVVTPLCCLFSYMAADRPEELLASTEFGNHRYHITVQGMLDEAYVLYSTYSCDMKDLACEKIYTDIYNSVEKVSLIVDRKMNELYVLRRDDVLFIDGTEPREILTTEQYGDFMYYISTYPPYGSSISVNDQNIYMLYKCRVSLMGCEKLPFHYTDTGGSFKLIFDENTQELRIYQWKYKADDILIYTYGTEPKCYVERCSIVDN